MSAFDLSRFLKRQFAGLHLPLVKGQPFFSSWSIGLRFELGINGQADLAQACARATTLYEAAFQADEVVAIVGAHRVSSAPSRTGNQDRGPLFSLNTAVGLGLRRSPDRSEVVDSRRRSDESSAIAIEWVSQPARSFDYRRVFQAIAHADFALQPAIEGDVYLLSPSRSLMFWMYDDRGLDMIAVERATLQPLYQRYGAWLLDHDRRQMDEIFSAENPDERA